LNTIRKEYDVEERARYFKKLKNGGINVYQISESLSLSWSWVQAHLNVFKLPQEVQDAVWSGALSISHVEELEEIIGAGRIDEAADFAKQVMLRRMTRDELRKTLAPATKRIEEERVEAAKKAVSLRGDISLKLEDPREMEKAARALLKEAKQKQEEMLTPKERESRERGREIKRQNLGKVREALEEKVRVKVEQEVRKETASELVKDPEVVRTILRNPQVREVAKQMLMPTESKKEEKELPKHWAEGLATDSAAVQEGKRWAWNAKRIGKVDFFTTSYQGRDLDSLIETWKAVGIKKVIDVRDSPYSQFRPDMNKSNLEKVLPKAGIDYESVPELGVSRSLRDELAKTGDYDALWKKYDVSIKDKYLVDNDKQEILVALDPHEGRLAYLCVERDPTKCHRHRIALNLEKMGWKSFDV
jgi:hypothetical protein